MLTLQIYSLKIDKIDAGGDENLIIQFTRPYIIIHDVLPVTCVSKQSVEEVAFPFNLQ